MTETTHTLVPTAGEVAPLLRVRDLRVDFGPQQARVPAVRGVDLELRRGEVLGIVGESGSGKSVTANAIMGLHGRNARISGSVQLEGQELIGAPDSVMNRIRGSRLAMIFQDPMTSLNPVLTIGQQIVEAIRIHRKIPRAAARAEAIELLEVIGITKAATRLGNYPHEFSGGMRQRVVIAIAMANNPDVIIADEPTTALDVTVQMQVLDALERARRHVNAALILVTHDLGVIAGHADRVVVMYGGRVVESGRADDLFHHSRMPYTRGLLAATPRIDDRDASLVPIPGAPPAPSLLTGGSCPFAPRCPFRTEECDQSEPDLIGVSADQSAACHYANDREHVPDQEDVAPSSDLPPRQPVDLNLPPVLTVTDLTKEYVVRSSRAATRTVYAVNGVSFEIRPGETLGLVGESGCGKSSVSRSIVRLQNLTSGEVALGEASVSAARGRELKRLRRQLQMVFQDPYSSLDPRFSVRQLIGEALRLRGFPRADWDARTAELLTDVGLAPSMADRYPHEFSGGQRQRLGIARALATDPEVLVLDEPVSALDVSVQAGVVNLLRGLQTKHGLSYLFIAHDLSVVANICDRIAVMYLGRIVEIGTTEQIFTRPQHPYTAALISAVPIPDPRVERARTPIRLTGDAPSALDQDGGCPFRGRCHTYRDYLDAGQRERCDSTRPDLEPATGDTADTAHPHLHACHYPELSTRPTNEEGSVT